jgi:hypothetical protein
MSDGFKSLSDIINTEPGLDKIRKTIYQSDVIIEFNKIFPELEKVVIPVKVERKVLHLKVENSAWRNELKFREKKIVDKINKFFVEQRVVKIKFVS